MIEIIDNFLPEYAQDNLEKIILGKHIEWKYYPGTCNDNQKSSERGNIRYDDSTQDHPQFVHILKDSRDTFSSFYPLVQDFTNIVYERTGLKFNHIHRAKINLQLPVSNYNEYSHNMAHVDLIYPKEREGKCMSLLYYVNDSDGDTVFFKERHGDKSGLNVELTKTPKKGTAVLFDWDIYHASSIPRLSKHRIVVNLVLIQ